MVICKIWDADYPWDIRVEKVCQSVRKKHEVHLVCRNTNRRPTYEQSEGIHIHRLPFVYGRWTSLNKLIGFPLFCNPLWLVTVWRVIRKYQVDLILVRDLPLALTALLVGRLAKKPVVLDMAENYPAMLQDRKQFGGRKGIAKLIRNPRIARVIEQITMSTVDHIIVVVDESRDRLIRAEVPRCKLSVVANTPRLDSWPVVESAESANGSSGVELVYLGNLDPSRGVDVAIRALKQLRGSGCSVRMTVIGDGPCIQHLRDLVKSLDLEEQVSIVGRLSLRELQPIMSRAHIGIIPHYVTDAWNTTMPNKLFDYMAIGKPVIVSNARPVERVVIEEGCGVVFRDRDPKSLAEAIMTLSEERVRRVLGQRGRMAVIEKYNWALEEAKLLDALHCVGRKDKVNACAESWE